MSGYHEAPTTIREVYCVHSKQVLGCRLRQTTQIWSHWTLTQINHQTTRIWSHGTFTPTNRAGGGARLFRSSSWNLAAVSRSKILCWSFNFFSWMGLKAEATHPIFGLAVWTCRDWGSCSLTSAGALQSWNADDVETDLHLERVHTEKLRRFSRPQSEYPNRTEHSPILSCNTAETGHQSTAKSIK